MDLNKPEDEDGLKEYQDYHIIEELPYWENGAYFVSRFRNTLFTYQEEEGVCQRVTAPLFAVSGFELSGETIVYTGVSYDQVLPMKNGMYGYDCRTKTTTEYVKDGDMHIGLFGCCGEGRDLKVFFAGSTINDIRQRPVSGSLCMGKRKSSAFCKARQFRGSVPTGDISLGGGKKFLVKEGVPYFTSCARTRYQCFLQRTTVFPRQWILTVPWTASARWRAVSAMVEERPENCRKIYLYDSASNTYHQVSF